MKHSIFTQIELSKEELLAAVVTHMELGDWGGPKGELVHVELGPHDKVMLSWVYKND